MLSYKNARRAVVGIAGLNVLYRYCDYVTGTDDFAKHTNEQHQSRFISGMHDPFMPTKAQYAKFMATFPEFQHMLPRDMAHFQSRRVIHTPVQFLPLRSCPNTVVVNGNKDFSKAKSIVVGGAPALISSMQEGNIMYINDARQIPIADGSAFHLEWDSPSEKPTTFLPTTFMAQQIKRVILPEWLHFVEQTGHFSWRSLDWVAWITRPESWFEGIRLAWEFQNEASADAGHLNSVTQDCAARCKANQSFYAQLDEELKGKLLLPARQGSIIVARDQNEVDGLLALKASLEAEGRELKILTETDIEKRYGFSLDGRMFGEKTHDKYLNPNFMQLLAERLREKRCEVVNGVISRVFTDSPEEGGILEYTVNGGNGERVYVPFKKLVLSLGAQRVLDGASDPMLDIVAARGVSMLAFAYLPEDQILPPGTVCGATNHVTSLAGPVPTEIVKDGKRMNAYLVKLTCSACITPSVLDETGSNYDAVAATGLLAAARNVMGCDFEVLTVWGCNRQVCRWGQGHWFEVQPAPNGKIVALKDMGTHKPDRATGILVQLGAGGGGLTQGPSRAPQK